MTHPAHAAAPPMGLGERRELPQRGPGQSPGRQRILGIFHGIRTSEAFYEPGPVYICTYYNRS